MQHRILGLGITLTFLFSAYAAAWLRDPNELGFVAGKPDAVNRALEALALASSFSFGILFLLVWPQTLLAGWVVRRFHVARAIPFILFFSISSIAVLILDFTVFDNHRLIAYLVGTGYLLVSCSILWLISFRHEPVV